MKKERHPSSRHGEILPEGLVSISQQKKADNLQDHGKRPAREYDAIDQQISDNAVLSFFRPAFACMSHVFILAPTDQGSNSATRSSADRAGI